MDTKFWNLVQSIDTVDEREITYVEVNQDGEGGAITGGFFESCNLEGAIEYSYTKGGWEAVVYRTDTVEEWEDEGIILEGVFNEYDVALRLVKSLIWKLVRMPRSEASDAEASSWDSFSAALAPTKFWQARMMDLGPSSALVS